MATAATDQILIFTYGTLKQNFPNHHIISTAAVLISSSATTVLPYPLLIGPYGIPYLINLPGYGHCVSGELYSVSNAAAISDLDDFEGLHRGHYERLPVKVVYDHGGDSIEKEVMAYFAHRRFAERMWKRCGPEKAISEYKMEDAEKYAMVEQRPRNEVFFEVLGKFVGSMDGEDSLDEQPSSRFSYFGVSSILELLLWRYLRSFLEDLRCLAFRSPLSLLSLKTFGYMIIDVLL